MHMVMMITIRRGRSIDSWFSENSREQHRPSDNGHYERSSENACEDPPNAATALADSLGENARWSRIMVIGSKYPMVLAWSLSSCRSTLTDLPCVTWCSSFHPKRWYDAKLSGSGRSLYVFLTIAWSHSMTVSGRKKWSALPNVVGGAPQSRKLVLMSRMCRKSSGASL